MANKRGSGFNFKFGKFQASFSNRWTYTFIAVFILALLGVVVYALGSVPNPGHAVSDLQTCDNNGEILKMSGGSWTCSTDDSGGSSIWSLDGNNAYYDGSIRVDGDYKIYSSNGNQAGYIGANGEGGAQNGIRIVSQRGSGEIEFWTNDATTQEEISIENDGTLDLHGNDIVNVNTINGEAVGGSTGPAELSSNTGNSCSDSNDAAIAKKWQRPARSNDAGCSGANTCSSTINRWYIGSSSGPGSCTYVECTSNPTQCAQDPSDCESASLSPTVVAVACIGDA